MLLREVEYARPARVQEALRLLGANDGARALAGGQTLINVMKARAASPDVLVDLADIAELRGIELGADGTLELGAMTTYTDIINSAEARARPILGEVCNQIADVQVRNRGTIGGNVCSNDPTNHLPPLLVAIGATMTIVRQDCERGMPRPTTAATSPKFSRYARSHRPLEGDKWRPFRAKRSASRSTASSMSARSTSAGC